MKKVLLFIISIVAIVFIDQYSKIYVSGNFRLHESISVIDGFFNLTYVQNKGAAFGFGGQFDTWIRVGLFKVLPVAACAWLLVLLLKSLRGPLIMSWAYTFILGGAVGNIIDRIRLDYVIDFFDFYYGAKHFATFNVADSAITLAAGLIILDFFINRKEKDTLQKTR
jgi:signal peptidase II